MDNKLTLRQIAPGLFSNPETIQAIPPSLQPRPDSMDPSMQDKILAALAKNGMLGQADNMLQQMPQKEDFSALVNSLKNRSAEPPVNSPLASPASTPSMQASRPMRPIDQEPAAQATDQAAQQIGGQTPKPYNPDSEMEENLAAIQKTRQPFGGAK